MSELGNQLKQAEDTQVKIIFLLSIIIVSIIIVSIIIIITGASWYKSMMAELCTQLKQAEDTQVKIIILLSIIIVSIIIITGASWWASACASLTSAASSIKAREWKAKINLKTFYKILFFHQRHLSSNWYEKIKKFSPAASEEKEKTSKKGWGGGGGLSWTNTATTKEVGHFLDHNYDQTLVFC